jgi:hypothetical protein
MSLTGDEFNEIIQSLRSDIQGKRGFEKRGAPRVGLRSRGTIVSCEHLRLSGAPTPVWIRDLSVSGIGIIHCHPLEPGMQFVAQFLRPAKPPLSVLYTVTHTKPISKTIFSIGAKMEQVMDEATAQIMSAPVDRAGRRPA